MRIRWLRTALANLDEIATYVGTVDPSAARRLVLRIESAVLHLAEAPHLGRPGRVVETRELVIAGTDYIVPYRVKHGTIEIMRIIHGARRWPEELP